jgi:hypothetical protein
MKELLEKKHATIETLFEVVSSMRSSPRLRTKTELQSVVGSRDSEQPAGSLQLVSSESEVSASL